MPKAKKHDLIVIGAGSAGLSITAGATMLDVNVALIEGHKMGGDCLNYGCVPSKSLLAAAKQAHLISEASSFGIQCPAVNINFTKVMQHVHQVIQHIARHDSVERFTKLGATVYQGHAEFVDKKTVKVGNYYLSARRIVIATGSTPYIPDIPGLGQVNYLTNESIFGLTELPEHLIVIGGGPIGCELSQAMRFLGSQVTLISNTTLMPKDEKDLIKILRHQLVNAGITLHENADTIEVQQTGQQVSVKYQQNGQIKKIDGTHLLIATGRRPQLSSLNLDKADVRYNSKGIEVNHYLQTSNKKIYAIGDAVGTFQFTHIASYHASIVLKNILFRLPTKVNYNAVPWVTYTYPELAHVGLSSEQAKQKQIKYRVTEFMLEDVDRAQAERLPEGKVKVITSPNGRILGASILAPNAGEMIVPWILLIRDKKTLRSLTDTIIPYPALSELNKHVAGQFYKPVVFSKWMKKLVHFLQKLG